MELNFSLEIPKNVLDDKRADFIESDISTIISVVYSTIPLSERKNIKLIDIAGDEHQFTSFEQIKYMYRKEGFIKIYYSGKNHDETGDYLPTRD